MKRSVVWTLVAGIVLGVLGTAGVGAAVAANSASIREVLVPGRQNGIEILGEKLILVGRDAALEDLSQLPNTEETRLGRYQMLVREGEKGSILVLDTQNGMIREWADNGRFRVYNPSVPNHVIETTIRQQIITGMGTVEKR